MRYIVFDVETPNAANDRMSAIGVDVVEDGAIIKEFYTLINPETRFDSFNIQLTGITPAMVQNKLTFPQVWELLEPIFSSGVLVAHNAPFDMGVLGKCLRQYGIEWKRYAQYACTCQMGRRLMPELENHRLNTMCACINVPLQHHNAASDTRGCAALLNHYREMGADITKFHRVYDLLELRTVSLSRGI